KGASDTSRSWYAQDVPDLEKRTWVYWQRPAVYGMAPCPCGNDDPDWSEFKGHLWCSKCEKDFIPEHGGVFDGPIPINAAHLLGLCFARINLETQQIIPTATQSPSCCHEPQSRIVPAPTGQT